MQHDTDLSFATAICTHHHAVEFIRTIMPMNISDLALERGHERRLGAPPSPLFSSAATSALARSALDEMIVLDSIYRLTGDGGASVTR